MISKRIAAVMIDLSGTVHVGENLLPGAKEAVDLLRENRVIFKSMLIDAHYLSPQVPFLFVSNNSKEPVSKVVERLEGAGLKVNSTEIFTSLSAAKHLGSPGLQNPKKSCCFSEKGATEASVAVARGGHEGLG